MNIRHGQARDSDKTSDYGIWGAIKQRCHNPKAKQFYDYGGRGISVCDRWRTSFENFFADMGQRPSTDHSIDRIDCNGNYAPGNCRWATKLEQQRNTRAVHRTTFLCGHPKTDENTYWHKVHKPTQDRFANVSNVHPCQGEAESS